MRMQSSFKLMLVVQIERIFSDIYTISRVLCLLWCLCNTHCVQYSFQLFYLTFSFSLRMFIQQQHRESCRQQRKAEMSLEFLSFVFSALAGCWGPVYTTLHIYIGPAQSYIQHVSSMICMPCISHKRRMTQRMLVYDDFNV